MLSSAMFLHAQVPQGISYQAVARDQSGDVLKNTNMTVRLAILQGGPDGTVVWQEDHPVTTNDFGLFSLMIGDPDASATGGSLSSFDEIDWSLGDYYLHVSLDLQDGGGFVLLGETALLTVPYAYYARDVENKDDADADPANEIQDLQLNGNLLSLTLNGNPTMIDLSPYLDNTDDQQLQLTGHTLGITGGNTVTLPDNVNDADADPANEIQDLQLNGNILTITGKTGATQIDLSPYLDNPGWNRSGDTLNFTGSVAVGTDRPEGSKLAVQGDDVNSDKPLFEVKRKDGQTVFAVYNDSIRMYVDDTPGKGLRGGFAIGGFDAAKGRGREYMRVTPDSVRIYIDQSQTKGPRGGFAIGGFDAAKGGAARVMQMNKDNYFIGHESGIRNTTGLYNAFLGYGTGKSNTSGSNNLFFGNMSGANNTTGDNNIFIGDSAGYYNSGGYENIYVGQASGFKTALGYDNVYVGYHTGYAGHGQYNVYIGHEAGKHSDGASLNTFIGKSAGRDMVNGDYNVIIGCDAGWKLQNGRNNVIIGNNAGASNVSGIGNVYIGYGVAYMATDSNKLYIDNNGGNRPLIWGDFSENRVEINGNPWDNTESDLNFFVRGTAGGLYDWFSSSDERLKKNIQTIPGALNKVMQLRGVNFEWKDENTAEPSRQMGFIAQEAEKVIPEVVSFSGKYYTMQYAPITALLVEAIKEQQKVIDRQNKKIEELEALKKKVDELEKRLDALSK